mgnify:CR=1 FL=1
MTVEPDLYPPHDDPDIDPPDEYLDDDRDDDLGWEPDLEPPDEYQYHDEEEDLSAWFEPAGGLTADAQDWLYAREQEGAFH